MRSGKMWSAFLTEPGAMKRKDDSAAAYKALRAIAIPAACIPGLLLSLGGAPQLQTTPDQAAQLQAGLRTNPEDLAAHERLINYYFDEATAPPLVKVRSEEHTSELQSPCNLVC